MRSALLALVLFLGAQDKGLRKLEWKLAPDHAAEFVFLDRGGRPTSDKFLVLSSELTGNTNRIIVDTYDELPLPLLFQLPPDPLKTTAGWEYSAAFFHEAYDAMGGFEAMIGGGSIRPVAVKGRYLLKTVKKADDEIAYIEGAFSLYEIRRDFVNNQTRFTVSKNEVGTLATSVQFSVPKGMILKAGWQYKTRGQEREGGRIVEKKIETHQMVEFGEDLALEPAKLDASRDAALAKAVDWLKKQAKGGSWQPSRPNASPGEAIHLTALVVRALLAAGVKPDDPVLQSAAKSLRVPAPPENAALAEQILALSTKSPSKDEAEEARRLGEELLRRRDARTNGWGPGTGRNDVPNLTLTALALEALTAVPDLKVPEEALRSGLEIFTTSAVDNEGTVDLDVQFEKDAKTLGSDSPKGIVPACWPAQLGRAGGFDIRGARRGTMFTQVAALRTLVELPEKIRMDDKQQKAVEGTLRKGLAELQLHWTFRTVPPVEAAWCSQRLEYFGQLGAFLSRARVVRVFGSDWRLEGTAIVLREQGEDGSWFAGTDQAVAKTAHALLFLGTTRR